MAAALGAATVLAVFVGVALAATGDISTVAGTGTAGFSGDDGPATAAEIRTPTAVAATADGGYVFSDQGNSRVRRVSPSGVITTIAGNGTAGFGGDDGPATSAMLNAPNGLAEMPDGSILIADSNNNRVRRVSPGASSRPSREVARAATTSRRRAPRLPFRSGWPRGRTAAT